MIEPKESFPYKPPSPELRNQYANIFELNDPIKQKILKQSSIRLLLERFY